jgi:hypothetical protein
VRQTITAKVAAVITMVLLLSAIPWKLKSMSYFWFEYSISYLVLINVTAHGMRAAVEGLFDMKHLRRDKTVLTTMSMAGKLPTGLN